MRAPPPVETLVDAAPFGRRMLQLAIGAAVGVPVAWAAARLGGDSMSESWREATQALAGVLAGGLAAIGAATAARRRADRPRTLRWDGSAWTLGDPAAHRPREAGRADLMLDLGPWLLVRFRPGPAPARQLRPGCWLAFSGGTDSAAWTALRDALWSARDTPAAPR